MPLFSIERTTNHSIIVSWLAPSTGWLLQNKPDLNTTNWVKVAQSPEEVGGRMQVVVFPPAGNRCYRLKE